MTQPHPNGLSEGEPDARRMSSAWDDLVAGRPVEVGGPDDELIRLAQMIDNEATTVRERPGYRQHLRDTIMHAPTTALPSPRPTWAGHTDRLTTSTRLTSTSIRQAGVRWLSLAATVALLLATAAGGYLAGFGLPERDGRGPTMGAYQEASPVVETSPTPASPSFACGFEGGESSQSPYLPCLTLQEAAVSTEVRGTFSAQALAATSVQMQDWTVEGRATVAFGAPRTPVEGVAVDFVLDGAYVASFDGSATVTPASVPNAVIPMYEKVPSQTPIELTAGDAVVYEIGTKRSLSNALSGSSLIVKTILIHDGDPSPGNLAEPSAAFTATVDGDGVLPLSVGEYGELGPYLLLNYVRVLDVYPFPPEVTGRQVVIGPVAGPDDPTEVSGWVLWASTSPARA